MYSFGHELCFFGGLKLIVVTEKPIVVEDVTNAALQELNGGAGAVVTFLGTVRNNAKGHRVQYLEYQAYAPMAEFEMRRIQQEVKERWDCPCSMVHRVGRLEIGEASIVIAVATPHRKQAFEACEYAINRVKETVPVWKKEVAEDGYWWVEDPLSAVQPSG
jgi:molybdopterin synthase catalytic subunit